MESQSIKFFTRVSVIFLLYVFSAVVYRYYFMPTGYPILPLEIVWAFFLVIFFIGVYFAEKKSRIGIWQLQPWRESIDVWFFGLALFALRFLNISKVNLWLDEDTQLGCSILHYPTAAGGYQSQPPLDMVFTAIGIKVSDYAVWGQRFHAAVFSAMAGVLIYVFSKAVTKSRLLALTLASLFSFQFYVVQYGYEARPISLSLFCEILLLTHVFVLFNNKEADADNSRNWSLGALTYVYLCSLGLQPVLVVAGIICFLGVVAYFKKEIRGSFWAALLGLLCFLPIQNFVRAYSTSYLLPLQGLGVTSFLAEIKVDNYYILNDFFKPYGYLVIIGFFGLFLIDFYRKKSFDWQRLSLFFILGFFCSVLIPFYKSRINYALVPRYVIACLPLIFMQLACELKSFVHKGRKKTVKGAAAVLLVGVGAVFYNFGPLWNLESAYEKDDLRAVYTDIKKISPQINKNLVLALGLRPEGWYPETLLNNTFYYRKDPRGVFYYWHASIRDLEEELQKQTSEIEDVFFIYYESWSDQKLEVTEDVTSYRGVQLVHLKVQPGKNLAKKVINFLEPIFKKGMAENKLYIAPLEYLVVSYNALHNKKMRDYYIGLYKKLKTEQNNSSFLDERLQSSAWDTEKK